MNTQDIIALSEKNVMKTYGRLPVAFVKGEGCYLWDAEGKKYLDMLSGIAVNALGHCHPAIVEVVSKQVQTLVHTSNLFYIQPQAELAEALCEISFADKVFFSNSGAEANEAAAKLARRYGKTHKGEDCFEVLTVEKSFHGRTLAMVAATGQEKVKRGFSPLPEGFRQVPFGDFDALSAACSSKTAAIMLELIIGEGGVQAVPQDYLQQVRKLCNAQGILLIFDEIQTGLGRTGELFAYQHSGVAPDIMTLAKALGNGLPIGACLAREEVAQAFGPGDHATTFGGNFLVCEAAKTFLEILQAPGFMENVRDTGEYFQSKLSDLKIEFPFILEVRGFGMMLGMELSIPGRPLVELALKKGLIINCVQDNTLRFLPPLIATSTEVDEAMSLLKETLSEGDHG